MTILGLRPSDRPATIDGATGEPTSYRKLIELATDAVTPLGGSKEVLFLLSRNDRFTVSTYAGALLRGHAVALLDARSPVTLTKDILATYMPAWLGCPTGDGDRLRDAGVPVQSVRPVAGGELVRTGYAQRPPPHPDLAVMLSTSGTTGSTKFVRLSYRNVSANAMSIAGYLRLTARERPVTSLPLHYSFGLSVLNSHWLSGAAVVLTDDSVMQASFWDTFGAQRCTSLAGVPFTYQMLERVGFRNMEIPDLRTLQQAGGALDRRLITIYAEFMASRGGRFFVMYGQTEATARMAYLPPGRLPDKLGSVGVAVPEGRLSIETDNHTSNSGQATGEVVYEGPNVMMGYASGAQDLGLGDQLRGVLRTGDIGYLDGDGFLFLVGRSKRIAKVFGVRVNLDELEAVLRERGPAAVVGRDDAIWGFCGFGTDRTVQELAQAMARDFKLQHGTFRLRRVEAIPTTSSGKTDYRQVEQWVTR